MFLILKRSQVVQIGIAVNAKAFCHRDHPTRLRVFPVLQACAGEDDSVDCNCEIQCWFNHIANRPLRISRVHMLKRVTQHHCRSIRLPLISPVLPDLFNAVLSNTALLLNSTPVPVILLLQASCFHNLIHSFWHEGAQIT